jgi:hypothetical protein
LLQKRRYEGLKPETSRRGKPIKPPEGRSLIRNEIHMNDY